MVQKFETNITPFGLQRTVHLYLPDEWMMSSKTYPVLYMFDGHNLFFDEDATYGKCWGLKDYLDATRAEMIVVGVECNHEGNNRLAEYCPYDMPPQVWGGFEGRGIPYLNWLVEELKPQIDMAYPTRPERENTWIAGSSMGGLMSLYAGARYNEVFGRAACLSSSIRICMPQMEADLSRSSIGEDSRFYLSWGSEECRNKHDLAVATENNLKLAHILQQKGAQVYPYLHVGGGHCEASWEEEIPVFMDFLKN